MSTSHEIKRASVRNSEHEFKFKAGNAAGTFSGYGAVFGNIDSHGDVIVRGAFKKSLQQWNAKGRFPKMLLQHGGYFGPTDDMLPVGQWTSMEEDTTGLKVEGRLFGLNTDRGALIYEGLTSGELDGLSIGYRATKYRLGSGKPKEPDRWLDEIDLKEVSIVTWGSNERALISAAKSQIDANEIKTARSFERMLMDVGFAKKFAIPAARAVDAAGLFSTKATTEQVDEEELLSIAKALSIKG
ncbi:HK97 family phage prohead protease [Rhizobium ruizarguesonis]|uniref:HK97 family phage prohead protease n=1 Tax=Rhizobium ruizarguesonis TaxID=2081791 RepID=UPI0010307A26|nr:HK97 family phage prohead protease [Rhizobium ruizarguesonis]TBC78006.1 HK97 family phage prohead protease [Rhizobium ruizarguesonis]